MSPGLRRVLVAVALLTIAAPACLAQSPSTSAPPAAIASDPSLRCDAKTAGEARALAERLFQQSAYQQAGECYRASGDYARANKAYLKAARIASIEGARRLAEAREESRAQLQRWQAALRHIR